MTKKKMLSCLSALSVSWLPAACVPGLSDGVGLYSGRSSGSTPLSKGQTTEVHIGDILPRYLGIIEEVVVEFGDMLGVSGKNQVDGCATKDMADMDTHWMMMVIPAIDYEDLRRMIIGGAQRNGFEYSWDPVRRGRLSSCIATVGDEYGDRLGFYYHEVRDGIVTDLYSGCMFPFQPLDPDTPRRLYPLPSPGEMFPSLTIVQTFDNNDDENPELRP